MFDRLRAMFRGVPASGAAPLRAQASARAPYEAGSTGTRRTAGMTTADQGPTVATSSAATIRARARDAARNDGLARALVESWVDDVCGWGPTPRSRASEATVRDEITSLWNRWAEHAGSAGEDFAALCSSVVRSVVRDGEAFVRLRPRRPEDGLPVPLALEVIDPARVPVEKTETVEGGQVLQGVEFDAIGRRVAYHVLDFTPGEPMPASASALPRRVPAAGMLHVFDPERAGQVRGVSMLATSLPKLQMLDAYGDAVLLRSQLSNMFAAFLRTGAGSEASSVLPLTGEESPATEGTRPILGLQPGLFQELSPGEEVSWSEPPDPPQAGDFLVEQMRLACVAAGVPVEVATGRWGNVNDRLARVVLHAWRRRVERFRWTVLVPLFLRPVWEHWVALSGLPPVTSDPGWDRADWRLPAWPYLHPVQDVEAQIKAVRGGLVPLSSVIAEQTGEDVETVLTTMARDLALADKLGLRLDSDGRAQKGGAA